MKMHSNRERSATRFQAAGTSTVLIESGHRKQDPEKAFSRKLNVIGILTALRSISNLSYDDTELDHYHRLPPNGKWMFDILFRGVELRHPGGWQPHRGCRCGFPKGPCNRCHQGDR